jgi:hypothetical protein
MQPSQGGGRRTCMLPVRRSMGAGFLAENAPCTSKKTEDSTPVRHLSRSSDWPERRGGRSGWGKPKRACQESTECSFDRALCGRDGIRTHDRLSPVPASQAGTINHSDTLGGSQRSDSLEWVKAIISQLLAKNALAADAATPQLPRNGRPRRVQIKGVAQGAGCR